MLDNALTTYTADESGLGEGKPPVPPCILAVGPAKTQVRGRRRGAAEQQEAGAGGPGPRQRSPRALRCPPPRPPPAFPSHLSHAPALPCLPVVLVPPPRQVALEVDDRGKTRLVLKVTADFVRVQARVCVGGVDDV